MNLSKSFFAFAVFFFTPVFSFCAGNDLKSPSKALLSPEIGVEVLSDKHIESNVFNLWKSAKSDYYRAITEIMIALDKRKNTLDVQLYFKVASNVLEKDYSRNEFDQNDILMGRQAELLEIQTRCIQKLSFFLYEIKATPEMRLNAARIIGKSIRRVRSGLIPNYEEKDVYMNVLPDTVDLESMEESNLKKEYRAEIDKNNENNCSNRTQRALKRFLWFQEDVFPEFCNRIIEENSSLASDVNAVLKDAGY